MTDQSIKALSESIALSKMRCDRLKSKVRQREHKYIDAMEQHTNNSSFHALMAHEFIESKGLTDEFNEYAKANNVKKGADNE